MINTDKTVKMSYRLHTVADMITPGLIVADVGTDHGYIPIHQVLTGRAKYAYACDVAAGPLSRARENIALYDVSDKVETILSDGLIELNKLQNNLPESVVIAGMGGALICKILSEAGEILKSFKELILSPHSEVMDVREYLYNHGFCIEQENMVYDEKKYYVVIRAVPTEVCKSGCEIQPERLELMFGPRLIADKNQVLIDFLNKELDTCEKIMINLQTNGASGAAKRQEEINNKIKDITDTLKKLT